MTAPQKLGVTVAVMAGILALPLGAEATTAYCKEIRLKPLHCVRGFITNEAGEFVPGATVTIFEDGAAQAVSKSDVKGQFSFGALKPGSYELKIEGEGYRTEKVPIVIKKPKSGCRQALEIRLTLGYPNPCTHVRIVKR
jgi:Carboxypeptidase regulatory-like domain